MSEVNWYTAKEYWVMQDEKWGISPRGRFYSLDDAISNTPEQLHAFNRVAREFVLSKAEAGSELHQRALVEAARRRLAY